MKITIGEHKIAIFSDRLFVSSQEGGGFTGGVDGGGGGGQQWGRGNSAVGRGGWAIAVGVTSGGVSNL